MEKPTTPTLDDVLETPDGQFFVERLASILLQQVEQEALAKTGQDGNETRNAEKTQ